MKKVVLILSFILVSVFSFAQRQRTTAMFDADTTTRPKTGFYGIGIRSNNIYFVPTTGNNIKLANYSLFTGLTTNYYVKWNGSKFVNTMMYGDGTNIGINTTSPGSLFDVRGQISASTGSLTNPAYSFVGDLNTGIYSSGADALALVTGGVNRIHVNSSGNVGIGTTSLTGINLAIAKNITGSTVGYGIDINAVAQTDVTNTARYIRTLVSNASGGSMTDITHMYLGQVTLNSVTNQTGIWITSTLTGATNNYGIRNQVSSGTGRWGLFFDGSVQNHIRGNVGIGLGSTVPATELEVRGVISASLGSTSSPTYTFVGDTNNGWYSPAADTQGWVLNASEVMRLNSTGLGIGVPVPTKKLDVNGEALIRDLLTINSTVTNEGGQVTLRNPTNYTKSFAIDNYQDNFRIINDTDGFTALSVNSNGAIAIGTTTANASSILDIPSTTKGVLLPRQTTTQINAISSPANGLMVYNTTLNKLCIYENGTWKQVTTTNM